jgi:hypothetical protein
MARLLPGGEPAPKLKSTPQAFDDEPLTSVDDQ